MAALSEHARSVSGASGKITGTGLIQPLNVSPKDYAVG